MTATRLLAYLIAAVVASVVLVVTEARQEMDSESAPASGSKGQAFHQQERAGRPTTSDKEISHDSERNVVGGFDR